jgi:hypothetical protein
LGISLEQIALRNPPEIVKSLGERAKDSDEIKRLADVFDLRVRAMNRLGLDRQATLLRFNTHKLYLIANAPTSAVKVGQEVVDAILSVLGDAPAARDFMERLLLPMVRKRKLLNWIIPIQAQYAVVLAYCGQIDEARNLFHKIREFSTTSSDGEAELDNQESLIEAIAAGQVTLPPPVPRIPVFATAKEAKVGRNQLCPCGSRRKFKKCCGR